MKATVFSSKDQTAHIPEALASNKKTRGKSFEFSKNAVSTLQKFPKNWKFPTAHGGTHTTFNYF